jgi:hypothetical protein
MRPTMNPSRSPTISSAKPISTIHPSVIITTNMPSSTPTTTTEPSRYPTMSTTNNSLIDIAEPGEMNSQSTISTEVGFFVVGVVLAVFLLIAIVYAYFARKVVPYSAIPKQLIKVALETREESITDTLRRLRTSDWLELTPEQIDDMFPADDISPTPSRSRSNSLTITGTYEVDEKVLMDRETNSPFV